MAQRINENTLQIVNTIGTDGYVRLVGSDGVSYRMTVQALLDIVNANIDIDIDDTLTVSGAAADAKAVGDELDAIKEDLEQIGSGVSSTVRNALYTLLNNAAYTTTGLGDEIAIIESWASEITSITLNQTTASISGSGTVQLVATTVPSGGTISWASSDTSIATVSNTGLVTGVNNGSATITASCGDLSATCAVTVSGFATLTGITATYTQTATITTSSALSDLTSDLVVTATYDDSSTVTLTSDQYTLSGTLTEGTSTITVSYNVKTTTFNVVVSVVPSGYTECNAIQTNNTNGNANEIDTGYSINSNTIVVAQCVLHPVTSISVGACSIFTDHSYNGYGFSYSKYNASTMRWVIYRGGATKNVNSQVSADTYSEYTIYANNTIVADGVTLFTDVTDGGRTSGNTMKLFGDFHDGTVLYNFKIYENDVLVAEYVPCIRNSDSMVGVYDKINRSFAGNANLIALT